MDPRTVQERRDQVQLLDVREPDEWAAGHIDGSIHIPLGVLPGPARRARPRRSRRDDLP
jgi:rhodanese-related sulfurtransferase